MVWDNAWVSSFQISHASDCYSNFLRERTSELTSDQTNEWTSHGRKDERTNKRANGRTNRRTDGRTNERTNERTSKGANERVNKWKNQRMNEYAKKHSTHVPLSSKAHLHFVSPFLYLNFSSTAGFNALLSTGKRKSERGFWYFNSSSKRFHLFTRCFVNLERPKS